MGKIVKVSGPLVVASGLSEANMADAVRVGEQYLIGEIPDRDDMLAQLAHAIKKFAKRQMTWFRRNPNIVWLDMQGDAYAQACEAVEAFLKK